MPQIAIIDDNLEQSSTLAKVISHYLRKNGSNLTVITQAPFHRLDDYFNFITDNDICVLILDEKLNVLAADQSEPVSYHGNQLITFLRGQLKDFPIFMVSNYINTDELQAKFSLFDYMLT